MNDAKKKKIRSKLSNIHTRIYDALDTNTDGMTVGECWKKFFTDIKDKSNIAPRFNEMLRMGVIEKHKKRGCNESSHISTVWKTTEDYPRSILYRGRSTEYHVIDIKTEKVIQRAESLRDIYPAYKENEDYEIWRSTSA